MNDNVVIKSKYRVKNGHSKSEISDRKVVILANNNNERGKFISKRAFDKVSHTTKDTEYGLESINSNFPRGRL